MKTISFGLVREPFYFNIFQQAGILRMRLTEALIDKKATPKKEDKGHEDTFEIASRHSMTSEQSPTVSRILHIPHLKVVINSEKTVRMKGNP